MNWETYYNFPVIYKSWLIRRIEKEINKRADNNQVPSKDITQNNAYTRELMGMPHPNAPHKLKRF